MRAGPPRHPPQQPPPPCARAAGERSARPGTSAALVAQQVTHAFYPTGIGHLLWLWCTTLAATWRANSAAREKPAGHLPICASRARSHPAWSSPSSRGSTSSRCCWTACAPARREPGGLGHGRAAHALWWHPHRRRHRVPPAMPRLRTSPATPLRGSATCDDRPQRRRCTTPSSTPSWRPACLAAWRARPFAQHHGLVHESYERLVAAAPEAFGDRSLHGLRRAPCARCWWTWRASTWLSGAAEAPRTWPSPPALASTWPPVGRASSCCACTRRWKSWPQIEPRPRPGGGAALLGGLANDESQSVLAVGLQHRRARLGRARSFLFAILKPD